MEKINRIVGATTANKGLVATLPLVASSKSPFGRLRHASLVVTDTFAGDQGESFGASPQDKSVTFSVTGEGVRGERENFFYWFNHKCNIHLFPSVMVVWSR